MFPFQAKWGRDSVALLVPILTVLCLLLGGPKANALEPKPIDLKAELTSATLLREIVVTQAECIAGKALCDRVRYAVTSSKTFRGKKETKAMVESADRLKVGQKYLQLVTSVKVSPTERRTVELFFPIFSQSSFASDGKGDQEWILLPRNVDAKSLGSVRLRASTCLEELPGQGSLLLCEHASALNYKKL